jgi:hypothetical protein
MVTLTPLRPPRAQNCSTFPGLPGVENRGYTFGIPDYACRCLAAPDDPETQRLVDADCERGKGLRKGFHILHPLAVGRDRVDWTRRLNGDHRRWRWSLLDRHPGNGRVTKGRAAGYEQP